MAEFNNELMKKVEAAKSPEEIIDLAKKYKLEIAEEQAKALYDRMNKSGELSDDELDNVSGGGCGQQQQQTDYVCPVCPADKSYIIYWECRPVMCTACGYSELDKVDPEEYKRQHNL